jgi:hypothetical protein
MNHLYFDYTQALKQVPNPSLFLDVEAFHKNLTWVISNSGDKKIRVATKSIRSVEVLKRIFAANVCFQGLMTYTLEESMWLRSLGFNDILMGYPTTDRLNLEKLAEKPAGIVLMVDRIEHLNLLEEIAKHRNTHFEICVDLDFMNITDEAPTARSKMNQISDMVLENWLYEGLNILAGKIGSYKGIDSVMRKFVSHSQKVNWSHLAFPTERTVKFMEMEFNLPIEKFESVFEELKSSIKKNNFQTLFPIEIRFVKGDELWLSPAYKRDSVYFAIHTYITEDYRPYFQ